MKRALKRALAIVMSGIAVFLIFSGVSAFSQEGLERVAGANPAVAVQEHPLMPVIRWAEKERPNIAAIKDYTATVRKQEHVDGAVQEAQVMEVKVRHQPFSVYIKFQYPQKMAGQQAIYVKGKNDDKLVAHGVGLERRLGTMKLDPEGFIAMRGNKYPITEMGVLNLVDKLLEVGYQDVKFGECEVKYIEGAKLGRENPREGTLIEVKHPVPRANFRFYVAKIFVDKEYNLPIRYESYDWPRREGETPTLHEVYQYSNLKLNVGLTDADFDHTNPAYAFP